MTSNQSFYRTALRRKAKKGFRGYPAAMIMFYGPDDRRATKVAVGVVRFERRRTAYGALDGVGRRHPP